MSREGVLGNEKAQARLRRRQNDHIRQVKDDLGKAMAEPWGRRLLYDVIYRRCGIQNQSWAGNNGDAAFTAGRRAIGIELNEELMNEHPRAYETMVVERIRANAEDELHNQAAKADVVQENSDG